jgi:antitoxin MazE
MNQEMKLKLSKWGNSLAIRLPIEYIRALGLNEGDSVEAGITVDGELSLRPDKRFDKEAFLARIAKLHASMPMTEPVVEQMRKQDRY